MPASSGKTPAPTPARTFSAQRKSRRWLLAALVLVAFGGVMLERTGVLDWHTGIALARAHAGSWWLAPALALVTAALFAAGMPGSLMVWVIGAVLPPAIALPTFVAGGVAGALGAYSLARRSGGGAEDPEDQGRFVRLLARRSDFATLVAVRIAPSFPHSAINFGAGLMAIPLPRFLAASAIGLAVKGGLYVAAIHRASQVATLEEAISWRTLGPLVALTLLLLLGPPLLRWITDRRRPPVEPPPPL